jgi:hypothetical protein
LRGHRDVGCWPIPLKNDDGALIEMLS